MQIDHLEIRNFRSISHLKFSFETLTALIGANNAGKSTILTAIELFFDSAPRVMAEDFNNEAGTDPIKITIAFCNLTPFEIEEFGSAVIDDKLTVTRMFSESDPDSGQYSVRAMLSPLFDEIRAETNGTKKRTAYNKLVDEIDGLQKVSSHTEVDVQIASWEKDNASSCEPRKQRGFFGAVNVANGKLKKKTSVHVVPAVRDISETASNSKKSPIIQLLTDIARQTFENKKNYQDFVVEAEQRFKELTDPQTIPELADVGQVLTGSLQAYYSDSSLLADWEQSQAITLTFPVPSLVVENNGIKTELSRVGHGLQRAALFAVVQFLAHKTSSGTDTDTDADTGVAEAEFAEPASDIILLVEEPEIYQHPSKQLVIFEAFRKIVEGFSRTTGIRMQLIYTTHSEKFIRMDQFHIARIVRKFSDEGMWKNSVSGVSLQECNEHLAGLFNPPRHPMSKDAFVAKLHIFTREVCEGFFAQKVILVEGVTDKAVLEALYRDKGRDVHQEAISIISVEGKTKMDKPFLIFSRLGIPTYLVFDNDSSKPAGKRRPETNKFLQKVCGVEVPDEWPVGSFEQFSAFSDKLEACLKGCLGEETYDSYFKEVSEEYELSYDEIKKTPTALVRILQKGRSAGVEFSFADKIIESVDNL
ncbi:ATP-dependent nuclease [Thalassospira alkalitolerans]|uniref:ATP-dependent nuclease n=1 Tax=Thalassospira alkalitolerans TaxID=1293890 RepID=UPI003AA95809